MRCGISYGMGYHPLNCCWCRCRLVPLAPATHEDDQCVLKGMLHCVRVGNGRSRLEMDYCPPRAGTGPQWWNDMPTDVPEITCGLFTVADGTLQHADSPQFVVCCARVRLSLTTLLEVSWVQALSVQTLRELGLKVDNISVWRSECGGLGYCLIHNFFFGTLPHTALVSSGIPRVAYFGCSTHFVA